MAALPIQSNNRNTLIYSYNHVWEKNRRDNDKGVAWIELKENGKYQAIKRLARLAFLTPTAERVQKALRDTQLFIGIYEDQFSPRNSDHKYFLRRVNQSFSKKYCGHEIDTTDLSRKISSILSYHIPTSHTDDNLHDRLKMYHIPHPISSDYLPHDDKEYKEKEIDVIFLIDGLYAYPAHRKKFLRKGEHWEELFKGHNNIVQIPEKVVTPDGLLSFLHAIYSWTFPNSLEGLLALKQCARYFHERNIYEKCVGMITRKSGSLKLQDLWECMQFASEKRNLRNRFEFNYASAVINAEIKEITPKMVNTLLECEALPCSEIRLLRFLEKWTEHHELDIVSYLNHIRFEWMKPKDFDTVVAKGYIDDASVELYTEVIQARQKNEEFPGVDHWKPRNYRSRGEVKIVDNSTESTIKKTLMVNLPLTMDQLKLTNSNRIIVKSQTFLMFAEKWFINVSEEVKKWDNYFGVYLRRETSNIHGPIKMDYEFMVRRGILRERKLKGRATWCKEHRFWGFHVPPIEHYIENDHLNITFNIEVDPKTLVYGKPS